MKNYAKVGNRPGKPAYRTASAFRNKKLAVLSRVKSRARFGRR